MDKLLENGKLPKATPEQIERLQRAGASPEMIEAMLKDKEDDNKDPGD